ncbi:hypothetical protein Q5P01_010044 [Channa striata]|uniref:Uncharacterized protein n=1 Tax=Channa striata TaxID=64152 RepID=A0AA88SST5_CHASR|nr:hypothetical protein Q5P01_010044 [Channa striata]
MTPFSLRSLILRVSQQQQNVQRTNLLPQCVLYFSVLLFYLLVTAALVFVFFFSWQHFYSSLSDWLNAVKLASADKHAQKTH